MILKEITITIFMSKCQWCIICTGPKKKNYNTEKNKTCFITHIFKHILRLLFYKHDTV